ncbi:rhomboid family intramembrane serine protease [Candidatus Phycosocius spiralis]|nr:rhomboid family intramembrane serine protease [Candidatus Phycosocius spiralis]
MHPSPVCFQEAKPNYAGPEPRDPSGQGKKPISNEPIFKSIPIGVLILIGCMVIVHIGLQLAGPNVTLRTIESLGVIPNEIAIDLDKGDRSDVMLRLIGHQFLHGGTLHLVMNMAMLLQAGPIAEDGLHRNRYGVFAFLLFFLLCGIGGGLAFIWLNPGSIYPTIGASGAISGVFAGFLWSAITKARPNQAMFKPVVTSGLFFLIINVGLAALARGLDIAAIAWESHLGGFVSGFIVYPIFLSVIKHRPKF